jgi:hypothetical protein
MLDYDAISAARAAHLLRDRDREFALNSFAGTFAISEHSRIPPELLGVLQMQFQTGRLSRVSMEDINQFLNSIWQGPGSLTEVFALERQLSKTANFSQFDLPRRSRVPDSEDAPVSTVGQDSDDDDEDAEL